LLGITAVTGAMLLGVRVGSAGSTARSCRFVSGPAVDRK
jgi:hypothetical protein